MRRQIKRVLIIDREGSIGRELASFLAPLVLVILVSDKTVEQQSSVVSLVYHKHAAIIPDNVYSHIVIVDNDDADVSSYLPQCIQKALQDDAFLFYLTNLHTVRRDVATTLLTNPSSYLHMVIVGDIFGKRSEYKGDRLVHDFFDQAVVNKRIVVPGDGLLRTYPVALSDVVGLFGSWIRGEKKPPKLSYLFPEHTISELSFAQQFHRVDPQITLDFGKDKRKRKKPTIPSGGVYSLSPNVPLLPRIKEELTFLTNTQRKRGLDEKKKSSSTQRTVRKRLVLTVFLTAVFVYCLPLLTTVVFSLAGWFMLELARGDLLGGRITNAKQNLTSSHQLFTSSKTVQSYVALQAEVFGLRRVVHPLEKTINAGLTASLAGKHALFGIEKLMVLTHKEKSISKEEYVSALNSFKKAIVLLYEMEAYESLPTSFKERLTKLAPLLQFASGAIEVIPRLVGFDGKKEYAILFQNNMELRGGGGFIGSYGLITLEQGKVKDFSIHNVYDADGQLKGHIEPPFAIRRHLPSAHLYFRDSNFSADFPSNASMSALFLKEELGKTVDGVVAVDVTLLQKIIEVVGSVTVPDYAEVVTQESVYMRMQEHAEKDFFPGSTQKKDYLSSLARAIQLRLFSGRDIAYERLLEKLSEALREKHILLAFSDSSIQQVFAAGGWSSTLGELRSLNRTTIADFLGVSEANLGVNKANYFIKRSIHDSTRIEEDGRIEKAITLSYHNTTNSGQWPGGDYKNYLRLFTPYGSTLLRVAIDGQEQVITPAVTDPLVYEAKTFRPPNALEIEQSEEMGKTIFGLLIHVPISTQKTLTLTYTLPQKVLSTASLFSYDLVVFKQPGTLSDRFSFSLSYPERFGVGSLSSGIRKQERTLFFDSPLSQDIRLTASFTAD